MAITAGGQQRIAAAPDPFHVVFSDVAFSLKPEMVFSLRRHYRNTVVD
jgi:hypothetical protein